MALKIDNQTFSDLLHALYGAATTSQIKNKHFLTQLKSLLNLQHATMIVRPPTTTDPGLFYTSGEEGDGDIATSSSEHNAYTRLYTQDPLVNLPLNTLVTLDEQISREQLLKSDFYRLFMQPHNVDYVAGIDWLYENNSRIAIRFTRAKSQGDFNEDEKQFFTLLIPHLQQSVALGIQLRQLDAERQIYADSISKRSLGIITLDKQGQILQSNATAQQYFDEADGLHQAQKNIKLNNAAQNAVLNTFIQEALSAIKNSQRVAINAIAVNRDSGKTAYQLLIKPMIVDNQNESSVTPYLNILIQDPEKNLEISVRTLMNLYQLTMSEATIAILLAEGYTTDEVATELNIKKNTVRAHLRAMFIKMGVSQQSMLVSQVLTSLASTQ